MPSYIPPIGRTPYVAVSGLPGQARFHDSRIAGRWELREGHRLSRAAPSSPRPQGTPRTPWIVERADSGSDNQVAPHGHATDSTLSHPCHLPPFPPSPRPPRRPPGQRGKFTRGAALSEGSGLARARTPAEVQPDHTKG